MKLRIRGNSVRIRLTRSEVQRLGAGETVQQVTEFSSTSRLVSSIQPSLSIKVPQAHFNADTISVLLPQVTLAEWWQSETVSIESIQDIEPGRQLQILVEKDFQCLHSSVEECPDAYPNPRGL